MPNAIAGYESTSRRYRPPDRSSARPRSGRSGCSQAVRLGRYRRRMATWDTDAETTHPLDYSLVHNSFVTMFWRPSLLDEVLAWLRASAYDVVEFDAASWNSAGDMYDAFAATLDFPDRFGGNLNALNDCLGDVASGDYGWRPDATGLVIVLRGFDAFSTSERRTAQKVLDILASQARSALLVGHRMMCLVQSNDPRLAFEPVGAMPVVWNGAEWLNAKRGL